MALHSHGQRFQATDDQPGIMRAYRRAHILQRRQFDGFYSVGIRQNNARHHVAMTVEVFSCAVNDNIDAVQSGLLQQRRQKSVINHRFNIVLAAKPAIIALQIVRGNESIYLLMR